MAERIFNFSAGPAVLPEAVLKRAQDAIWDLDGSGIGVLEHSHRGKAVDAVWERTEERCRRLAGIPDRYRILFLQGGASLQFCMLPANFLPEDGSADYWNTGSWSKKAIAEARRYGEVHVAATSEDENFCYVPAEASYGAGPAYVHFTSNNTIFGTRFAEEPTPPAGAWLACDTSSDLFSRPIDLDRYGLVYAGALKNLGPACVTLVILRADLLDATARDLPTMLRYDTHAKQDSRYNTPPVFGVYVMGEVFAWLLERGGLEAVEKENEEKARIVYDAIDGSDFFRGTARTDSRSIMNITFRAPSEELEAEFVKQAAAAGLSGLKGHRSVGGMRASLYNAFPREGCVALVQFMKDFERKHG